MEKEKKVCLKDLPFEILICYLKKLVLIICLTAVDVWFVVTSKMYRPFFVLAAVTFIYILSVVISWIKILNGKLYVFEGICIDTDRPFYYLQIRKKTFGTIYGDSNICIQIKDKKIFAPIYNRFKVNEGNTVRIYSFEGGMYEHSENAYIISSPLLISVVKI